MIHISVSDLFFNYQHDNYDALAREKAEDFDCYSDEARAALLKDATDFHSLLKDIAPVANDLTPQDLVADFIRRM